MLTPSHRIPSDVLFSYDKLLHLGAFTMWAMLAARAWKPLGRRQVMQIFGVALLLTVATELAQETITVLRRSGEVGDAVADLLGVSLGLGLSHWWERGRARKEEAR